MRSRNHKLSSARHDFTKVKVASVAQVLVVLLLSGTMHYGRAQFLSTSPSMPAKAPSEVIAAGDKGAYTLHVQTKEVVIEVIARDRDNHPVGDMTREEFRIYETSSKSHKVATDIAAFRTVDPNDRRSSHIVGARDFALSSGGRCEIVPNVHYQLAFHPQNWTSGYHTILVTTSRAHIKLSFRRQFYIGAIAPMASDHVTNASHPPISLEDAACYHPDVPFSVQLSAAPLESSDSSNLQYSLTIPAHSLELEAIANHSSKIQLQFGVCSFNISGKIVDYKQLSTDRTMDSIELSALFETGLASAINVPQRGNAALERFVVWDPITGNLGLAELFTTPRGRHREIDDSDPNFLTNNGGSLGSVIPRAEAMCGDVYELPRTTQFLPSNFRSLNAVGSIYTDSLNVGERILRQGIPGSTSRSEWFGVDYYGQFWIDKPGQYLFVLNADDGADLIIDDHMLIDDDGIHPPTTIKKTISLQAGRHTIRVPYFQGPTFVNIVLQIKSPEGPLKIFDVRDYQAPD